MRQLGRKIMINSSEAWEVMAKSDQPNDPSFAVEFWHFIRTERKWWLIPMLACLLLVGLLAVVSASPVAPFIYTLF